MGLLINFLIIIIISNDLSLVISYYFFLENSWGGELVLRGSGGRARFRGKVSAMQVRGLPSVSTLSSAKWKLMSCVPVAECLQRATSAATPKVASGCTRIWSGLGAGKSAEILSDQVQ